VERAEPNLIQNLEANVHQLQREVDELRSEKEHYVQELVLKNKLIVDLNKIITDQETFVYMISHDLKGSFANMLSLLSLSDISEGQVEVCEILPIFRRAVQRVNQSIEEISQVASLEDSSLVLEDLDLQEVLNEVLDQLRLENSFSRERVIIKLDIQKVFSLKKYLKSIFFNLINNAIKYQSPERDLIIEVKSFVENQNVILSVEDNGIGIKEEHFPHLFTKFNRLAQGNVKGLGLGLYLVQQMVKNLEGEIKVESEFGNGSKFQITLKNALQ
jgi:two-component system, chemotaxis family, CheB/CheR fusion protein